MSKLHLLRFQINLIIITDMRNFININDGIIRIRETGKKTNMNNKGYSASFDLKCQQVDIFIAKSICKSSGM